MRQRQFGTRLSPTMAAALDRRLPEGFTTTGDLDTTARKLQDATGVKFFIDWYGFRAAGLSRDAPVPRLQLGGKPLGDALIALLASLHAPLAYEVDDRITISLATQAGTDVETRVYDVRDLIQRGGSTTALEAEVKSHVAPKSWRDAGGISGSIRSLAGQLIVTTTRINQYDLTKFLHDARLHHAHVQFAARLGILMACAGVTALIMILIRHRMEVSRRRRIGLCPRCGYDLRASPERCPECGMPMA